MRIKVNVNSQVERGSTLWDKEQTSSGVLEVVGGKDDELSFSRGNLEGLDVEMSNTWQDRQGWGLLSFKIHKANFTIFYLCGLQLAICLCSTSSIIKWLWWLKCLSVSEKLSIKCDIWYRCQMFLFWGELTQRKKNLILGSSFRKHFPSRGIKRAKNP